MRNGTSEALGGAVLAAMGDPIVAMGPDASLLWANRAAEARFGWSLAELQGCSMVHLAHPDDLETGLFSLASVLEKEVGTLVELRIKDHTGEYSRYEIRGRAWTDGPVEGSVVLCLRELDDRHGWDVSGGDIDLLGAILDHLPTITILLAPDGTIRAANRALTRFLHRPLEQTLGRPLLYIVEPADHTTVQAELDAVTGTAGTRQLEASLLTRDGGSLPMDLMVVDLTADRTVRGLVVVAHDITPLVEVRRELLLLADHDDLTGLPNRTRLRDYLTEVLATPAEMAHTVLFGDVDNLKPVNDHHGHRGGDALLVAVAQRLRSVVRPHDFVARLGGDEFVVVVATADPEAIALLQERIKTAMDAPITLPGGHRVRTSISIGVAAVEPTLDADDVLAAADAAMYVAKRRRRGED